MDDLFIDVENRGDATVVNLAGSAGVTNEDTLRRFLGALFGQHPRRLVLNLSKLTFISSVCLGLFVALQNDVRTHGGQMTIAAANDDVSKVITRCRLDTIMPVYRSVDEAVS